MNPGFVKIKIEPEPIKVVKSTHKLSWNYLFNLTRPNQVVHYLLINNSILETLKTEINEQEKDEARNLVSSIFSCSIHEWYRRCPTGWNEIIIYYSFNPVNWIDKQLPSERERERERERKMILNLVWFVWKWQNKRSKMKEEWNLSSGPVFRIAIGVRIRIGEASVRTTEGGHIDASVSASGPVPNASVHNRRSGRRMIVRRPRVHQTPFTVRRPRIRRSETIGRSAGSPGIVPCIQLHPNIDTFQSSLLNHSIFALTQYQYSNNFLKTAYQPPIKITILNHWDSHHE